jgi:hypothetical protein
MVCSRNTPDIAGAARKEPFRLRASEALAVLLAVLAAGSLHFVAPNRSTNHYLARIGPIPYAFNPDSPSLARIVVRFPRGMVETDQGKAFLMRPPYMTAGWLIYQPLRLLRPFVPERFCAPVAGMLAQANHPEIWQDVAPQDIVLAWTALVIVNILMYWAAVWLVFRALAELFPRRIALVLAILPLAHADVISFVFVPHTQPFDLLIPAIFLYAAIVYWVRGRRGWGAAAAMGVCVLGKGLAYPALNWLYACLRGPRGRRLIDLCAMSLLLAAAGIAYLVLLKALGVAIYHYDTEQYRRILWMADYWHEGRPGDIPLRWVSGLGRHLLYTLQYWWPAIAASLLLLVLERRRAHGVPAELQRHLVLYTAAGIVFWCVVGVIEPVLTVAHYPVIVVLLGALAWSRSSRPGRWIAVCAGLMAVSNLVCFWWQSR